jgi:hypothetical protein
VPHRVGGESSSWYLRGRIARIVESPHEAIEPCPRGDRQSLAMGARSPREESEGSLRGARTLLAMHVPDPHKESPGVPRGQQALLVSWARAWRGHRIVLP